MKIKKLGALLVSAALCADFRLEINLKFFFRKGILEGMNGLRALLFRAGKLGVVFVPCRTRQGAVLGSRLASRFSHTTWQK